MESTTLNELSRDIHADNVSRGFYDEKREIGTALMLIVSEVAEALEADRKDKHAKLETFLCCPTPDNFKVFMKDSFEDEIADAIIRLLDLCGHLKINIDAHVNAKLAYNRTRGYKHGKNY